MRDASDRRGPITPAVCEQLARPRPGTKSLRLPDGAVLGVVTGVRGVSLLLPGTRVLGVAGYSRVWTCSVCEIDAVARCVCNGQVCSNSYVLPNRNHAFGWLLQAGYRL